MKHIFWSFLLMTLVVSCSTEPEAAKSESDSKPTVPSAKDRVTFKVIYNGEQGYGYQIFRGSKMLINQQHIPAVNGLYGFESKEKAELAAQFVIERMKQGIDRPTVKAEELDSIGAINLDSLNRLQ